MVCIVVYMCAYSDAGVVCIDSIIVGIVSEHETSARSFGKE